MKINSFLKKTCTVLLFTFIIFFILPDPFTTKTDGASFLEISDEEYNLYVDEYPDEVSNGIYAKFNKVKANVDDYYLNLSSENSAETFEKALKSAGITLAEDQLTSAFVTALYYVDPEGEADDVKKTDAVTVLCPIPDDAQEHENDCYLYLVSSGKAKLVSAPKQTDTDDIVYVRLELPSYGTYGFVYKDPETYDEEEDDEEEDELIDDPDEDDTDDEDGAAAGDKEETDSDNQEDSEDEYDYEEDENWDSDEDYNDDDEEDDESYGDSDDEFYYPDDEYYYDDRDGDSVKTASDETEKTGASQSSSKKPGESSSGSKQSSDIESKNSSKDSSATTISASGSYSQKGASKEKDSIPKTGDAFPLTQTFALCGGAGIILVITLKALKHK